MPSSSAFQKRHCLFCREREKIVNLYDRTFSESDLTPAVFSARRLTEHFHHQIVRCQNCGMIFSRDVLEEEILKDLYGESSVTFDEYFPVLRRDYWRILASSFKNPEERSALEIGCSSGFFLEELLARGFREVRGVEPSRAALQKASATVKNRILSGFFEGQKTFPSERFDLVCSFQTLDHISDPRKFVAGCYDVLKNEGLLCIVVHDTESLQAKILGEKSPIIDIEHVYLFNQRTLKRLLEENGFSNVKIGYLKNSYPLKYWIGMTPMPLVIKNIFGHAVTSLRLDNFSPAIAAGNIYAIAQRRDPSS